ncbi:MAG: hypothetical protein ACRC9L_10370 [Brevinema sp.]
MANKKYTMRLANGNAISNLVLNGNNYVSDVEVVEETFDGVISPVIITDGINEEVLENMELVRIANWENKWWILIQEKPPISENEKLRSDIEYVAMMCDIEL